MTKKIRRLNLKKSKVHILLWPLKVIFHIGNHGINNSCNGAKTTIGMTSVLSKSRS